MQAAESSGEVLDKNDASPLGHKAAALAKTSLYAAAPDQPDPHHTFRFFARESKEPGEEQQHEAPLKAPVMLASTEIGVYVKWALLLQEQMEQGQWDRARLSARVAALEAENASLRAALREERHDPLLTPSTRDALDALAPALTASVFADVLDSDTQGEGEITPVVQAKKTSPVLSTVHSVVRVGKQEDASRKRKRPVVPPAMLDL